MTTRRTFGVLASGVLALALAVGATTLAAPAATAHPGRGRGAGIPTESTAGRGQVHPGTGPWLEYLLFQPVSAPACTHEVALGYSDGASLHVCWVPGCALALRYAHAATVDCGDVRLHPKAPASVQTLDVHYDANAPFCLAGDIRVSGPAPEPGDPPCSRRGLCTQSAHFVVESQPFQLGINALACPLVLTYSPYPDAVVTLPPRHAVNPTTHVLGVATHKAAPSARAASQATSATARPVARRTNQAEPAPVGASYVPRTQPSSHGVRNVSALVLVALVASAVTRVAGRPRRGEGQTS